MHSQKIVLMAFILLLVGVAGQAQHLEQEQLCAHLKHQKASGARQLVRRDSRQHHYDVKFYALDLKADNLSSYVEGNVSMKAQVTSDALGEVVVGLSDRLTVDSVFIDGVKVQFTHTNDSVTATPALQFTQGDLFTSTIYYHGDGSTQSFFSGISNAKASTGDQVTWTLSQPDGAIDWFPCKQVLEDKADSAYIFVSVPPDLKVGSNGLLHQVSDVEGGRKRFEWKTHYPIAYYLISLAIAEYDEYNTSATVEGSEVPIINYIYKDPGVLNTFKPQLDKTADMMTDMSELYGPYPFRNEKYGHAMAPLSGGMEHQTMSTMHQFDFTLVAHELGHQWFGDNVTCASWQDIWVNEGFARYSEYLMIERLISKASADSWIGFLYDDVVSKPSGSVYVPAAMAEDELRLFDFRLTYNKGGSIVHMIRNVLDNDEVFFAALKEFQHRFSNATATGNDFRIVLEEVSGKSFDQFFQEWYYGEGHPIYGIKWNYDSDTLYIRQSQTSSAPSSVPFFHIPVDYEVSFSDGTKSIFRLEPEHAVDTFRLFSEKVVVGIKPDPQKWLLKKINGLSRDVSLKFDPIVTYAETDVASAFSIYPNPAVSDIVIRSSSDDRYHVTLIDPLGAELYEVAAARGDVVISSEKIPAGLYLVRISHASGSFVRRVEVIR